MKNSKTKKTPRKKSNEDNFLPGRNARPCWSTKQIKFWLAGETNPEVRATIRKMLATPPNKYTRL